MIKRTDLTRGVTYRLFYGTGGPDPITTLTCYDAEPGDNYIFYSFSFGENYHTVVIKDFFCGTQLERRYVYESDEANPDLEAIPWEQAVRAEHDNDDYQNHNPVEIPLQRFVRELLNSYFPEDGPAEITFSGSLKNGRQFYAVDTIELFEGKRYSSGRNSLAF